MDHITDSVDDFWAIFDDAVNHPDTIISVAFGQRESWVTSIKGVFHSDILPGYSILSPG